jgi:hypothetical protein
MAGLLFRLLLCSVTASPATSLTDDAFRYLDNGVVRLGVDLARGGSIGFFGPSGSSDDSNNIINCYDMGREVQLSFYAGPSFYNPDGKCDQLFMDEQWPWNPIGAGDVEGNHGAISTADVNDTAAHIVTTPLQWACDDVPCECEFEQVISLGGPADTGARVDATLHNHRTDDTGGDPVMSQELPAVYANGPYYRLLSSAGGAVVEYDAGWNESAGASPWVPGLFTADEHWAALVNEAGFGVGVVNLDTTDFLGGFSGAKGAGGPSDAPTGYIAPLRSLALPANATFRYTFYLVLGDVETIRAYAQQVAQQQQQQQQQQDQNQHSNRDEGPVEKMNVPLPLPHFKRDVP